MADPPSPSPVWIIDELIPAPGRLDEVRQLLLHRYRPGATERGMTLEHLWCSPPVELPEGPNRLTVVWSVADAPAWWRQRGLAGQDPAVASFWAELDQLLVERDRRVCTELPR